MNILVIGDTHIPFEHKNYLEFCKETQKRFKCEKVVHIGDLVDNHALSYHEHNPNGFSPLEELKKTKQTVSKWIQAFPELYLCKGNHDVLVDRKAITFGIPEAYVRSFEQVLGFPNDWSYEWKHYLLGICFEHGTGYSGQYPHLNIAKNNRCKTAIGHCHSVAGVEYIANDKDVIWGLSTGCGIDRMKYAFWYGKDFKNKPILSCGVVLENGKEAHCIPMTKKALK